MQTSYQWKKESTSPFSPTKILKWKQSYGSAKYSTLSFQTFSSKISALSFLGLHRLSWSALGRTAFMHEPLKGPSRWSFSDERRAWTMSQRGSLYQKKAYRFEMIDSPALTKPTKDAKSRTLVMLCITWLLSTFGGFSSTCQPCSGVRHHDHTPYLHRRLSPPLTCTHMHTPIKEGLGRQELI